MDGGWGSLDAEAYRALFFHSLDGVMFTDPVARTILAANPAACAMLGYAEEDICWLGRDGIMDPADAPRWGERVAERARTGCFRGELSFRRADGSTFPAEVTSQMFTDHTGAARSCIILRDITERRRLEHELWELALVDELTGLHNRRAFILLAEHAIKEAIRAQRPVFGLVADVDSLKGINDTWGHAEGDRALQMVADALQGSCRQADIVGRLSGDEFAILLAETHDLDGLEQRIRDRLADAARGLAYPLCVSIGVASCHPGQPHDCHLDDLLHRADQAMYANKTTRRGAPAEATAAAGAGSAVFRVVLVDDNEDVRGLWDTVLRPSRRFEVVARARDGVEGLAACLAQRPDAVVLDWQMPNVDGVAMARQLRAAQPDVVIVLCSVCRPHELPADLAALGITYLEKIHSSRLPALLTRLLTPAAGADGDGR